MTVSLELLWEAWPDGHLAMRGVSTVGSYVVRESQSMPGRFSWCRDGIYAVRPEDPRHGGWTRRPDGTRVPSSRRAQRWVEARDRGDLLPNLDPENDPATWACALRDLADAAGVEHGIYGTGFLWSHNAEAGAWTLDYNGESGVSFFIDSDDPATALATALTRARSVSS